MCRAFPAISNSMWLLPIGGLLGLFTSLVLLTIKARASPERTKRRLNRLTRKDSRISDKPDGKLSPENPPV